MSINNVDDNGATDGGLRSLMSIFERSAGVASNTRLDDLLNDVDRNLNNSNIRQNPSNTRNNNRRFATNNSNTPTGVTDANDGELEPDHRRCSRTNFIDTAGYYEIGRSISTIPGDIKPAQVRLRELCNRISENNDYDSNDERSFDSNDSDDCHDLTSSDEESYRDKSVSIYDDSRDDSVSTDCNTDTNVSAIANKSAGKRKRSDIRKRSRPTEIANKRKRLSDSSKLDFDECSHGEDQVNPESDNDTCDDTNTNEDLRVAKQNSHTDNVSDQVRELEINTVLDNLAEEEQCYVMDKVIQKVYNRVMECLGSNSELCIRCMYAAGNVSSLGFEDSDRDASYMRNETITYGGQYNATPGDPEFPSTADNSNILGTLWHMLDNMWHTEHNVGYKRIDSVIINMVTFYNSHIRNKLEGQPIFSAKVMTHHYSMHAVSPATIMVQNFKDNVALLQRMRGDGDGTGQVVVKHKYLGTEQVSPQALAMFLSVQKKITQFYKMRGNIK